MRLSLALACTALLPALAAHADSYTPYVYAVTHGTITSYGFTNDGNSFLFSGDSNGPLLYGTFTPPNTTTYSSTKAVLDNGSGPGDYVISSKSGGGPNAPLEITDGATGTTTVLYTGLYGDAYVNSYGDVAFLAYDFYSGPGGSIAGDVNVLDRDATTHPAVTPEPSSLILMGTGLLGAFGAARRRYLA